MTRCSVQSFEWRHQTTFAMPMILLPQLSTVGLRVYRFPRPKPNSPYAVAGVQANFVKRVPGSNGKFENASNYHVNVKR